MYMTNSEFQVYLNDQLDKQKDLFIPVNSSFGAKLLHKSAKCTDLHPNPDDEFCIPSVGPSYRIIGEYEKTFREEMDKHFSPDMEPLTVIKAHPHGYMLVNGHHRWAAALKLGIKKVPINIINLMLEEDIKRILEHSDHDKRVTLDLDEVVFRKETDDNIELGKSIVLGIYGKKNIRLGVPALFRYLKSNGYDIWVYSSECYSIDDVKKFLKKYQVHVDGILSAFGKTKAKNSEAAKAMKEMISSKYNETIHIDNDLLVITNNKSGDFEEHELSDDESGWSKDIISVLENRNNIEKKEI